MDDGQRKSVESTLRASFEQLLVERGDLVRKRAEIMQQLRVNERKLSDCRAAARFFGIEDALPEVEDRSDLARRELEMRHSRLNSPTVETSHEMPASPMKWSFASQPPARAQVPEVNVEAPPSDLNPRAGGRPPLKEFLLGQLQQAGNAGAKAAGLRAAFEHEFRTVIHEKTVGMTLYRLAQTREVHRNGHIWLYGPGSNSPPFVEIETE